MDYREFCNLFPQVGDKNAELKKRMDESTTIIECSPQSLADFEEAIASWYKKIVHKRDTLDIGCGVMVMPPDWHNTSHYSYDKGHFTEWEVQNMIIDTIELLQ